MCAQNYTDNLQYKPASSFSMTTLILTGYLTNEVLCKSIVQKLTKIYLSLTKLIKYFSNIVVYYIAAFHVFR